MGRLPRLLGLLILVACSKQSTTSPCVRTLDVQEAPNLPVNATTTLHATSKTKSGTCTGSEAVSWSLSSSTAAEILNTTDSTAVVRGKAAGKPFVTAWLTRIPTVRDSITLTVTAPVDASPAGLR